MRYAMVISIARTLFSYLRRASPRPMALIAVEVIKPEPFISKLPRLSQALLIRIFD
jgi:hypothetical protein